MERSVKIPAVRFNLKSHDKVRDREKEVLIVMIFRYQGQRMVYSTGEKVKPSYWDQKSGRARYSRKHPEYAELNTRLNDVANFTIEIFKENDFGNISIEDFKLELNYRTGRLERPKEEVPELMEFIPILIAERERLPSFKPATIKVYKKIYNLFKGYEEELGQPLTYDRINRVFRSNFESWLYEAPRKHSVNYVAKVFSVLKLFLREAVHRGYNKNTEFTKKGWSIKQEKTRNIILTFPELKKLYNLNLTPQPRLARIRDLFLIGAYSGLRYSDFTRIRPEHIIVDEGVEMLEIFTQKTDTEVVIPLMPELKAILEKYDYHSPSNISNQKMNQYLKEVCQLAGIKEKVIVKKSIGGVRTDLEQEKWELVTTHTARRSFATNFYELGIPAIHLMQITGHATEQQFMGYINISKRRNAKNIAKQIAFLMKQHDKEQ